MHSASLTSRTSKMNLTICFLVALVFMVFLSPQFGILGRGLRTALPAFVAVIGLAVFFQYASFILALRRAAPVVFLAGIFMVQAAARFWISNDTRVEAWIQQYLLSPILSLALVYLVFQIGEIGDSAIQLVQKIVLIGWGVSLSLGIPSLFSNYGIARYAMGIDSEDLVKTGELHLQGVGNFGYYTSFAILLPILISVVLGWRSIKLRLLGWVGLLGASISVLLSTLTMASVLLLVGGSLTLSLLQRGWIRLFWVLATISFLLVGSAAYESAANKSEQIDFVYQKSVRLFTDMSNEGLSGDETGRGDMIKGSIFALKQGNWLYGYIEKDSEPTVNGHSSMIDSLVLFGVPGTLLWFALLIVIARKGLTVDNLNKGMNGAVMTSWLLFFISGLMNPTWYMNSIIGPLLLFTFSIENRAIHDNPPNKRNKTRQNASSIWE